jgi:alkylated DNA repair dioxygenase AlkB
MAQTISGLRQITEYVSVSDHDRYLSLIDAHPWRTPHERRVQNYGFTYDPKRHRVEYIGPLCDWVHEVAVGLQANGLTPEVPNQVIVNEYWPGQGIGAHVDLDLFADAIVSITLGSHCVMDFVNCKTGAKESLFLEPRTALVLSGKARSHWSHGITKRKTDRWDGQVLPRGRRVSLTFRRVL